MSIFQQTLEQSDERFLRDVGISKATFQQLLDKVATYLAVQREKNPIRSIPTVSARSSEAGTSPYLMPSVGSMKRCLGAE